MITDTRLTQLRQVVLSKFGLDYPENRSAEITTGLSEAATEMGFSDQELFLEQFLSGEISQETLDVIAAHLTIGETYFFREPLVLEALRESILPPLIKEREHTTRTIRIWSAGCSSGEEPYSLAMILNEIIPDLSTWNISILATDINQQALDKAQRGLYTPWSFRETPVYFRNRYFRESGKEVEIDPAIRKMVTFRRMNLAEQHFPAEKTNTQQTDLLFCRNVLMYFSADIAKQIVRKFHESLQDGGWLFPSQVELSNELFSFYGKVRFGKVFLYQKTDKPPTSPPASLKRPLTRSGPKAKPPAKMVCRPEMAPPPDMLSEEPSLIGKARELANAGRLPEALKTTDHILAQNSSDIPAYYLTGMIFAEQEQFLQAQAMFSRVLYLDPHHLLSHFQMMNLSRKEGKDKKADKHAHNIETLLATYANEDLLPDGGGMTAGEFRHLMKKKPINQ